MVETPKVPSQKDSAAIFVTALVLAFCAMASAYAQHQDHAGPVAVTNNSFNSIKTLVGDWEGHFEWIGTDRKGSMNARYYLTGNGSALIEDLISDGIPTMTTVYHLNGNELRATHYCGAGNQPRLIAVSTDEKTHSVKFDMIDITNLATPESGHVKNLELRLTDPKDLTILFTFVASGKERIEQITLKRRS